MHPDALREHIVKFKNSSGKPFTVNVPLLYPDMEQIISVLIDEGVKIVFTSAGNPAKWTSVLKSKGLIVVHVVSSVRFALNAQMAGVDAVVDKDLKQVATMEGKKPLTLCLIPMVDGS